MTYNQFCKKIGGLIRLYRRKKGYKLKVLANELDVDYQHIQKLENGKNLPLFYNMLKIVEFLDIPGNKIFGKETDGIDLQELSKTYAKYETYIEALEKSKELREFLRYYILNEDKFRDINLVSGLKALTKLPKKPFK